MYWLRMNLDEDGLSLLNDYGLSYFDRHIFGQLDDLLSWLIYEAGDGHEDYFDHIYFVPNF